MAAPLRVQRAVARIWAKRFASEEQALGSREFSELARQCHAAYPAPDWLDWGKKHCARESGDTSYLEWHTQKLQTAFRNVGAPWYGGTFPDPQKASETIEFAYKGGPSTHIYLLPLDQAPARLPKAKFGPCRIRRFAKEELADVVRPSVLDRHKHDQFDVATFSQFSWLVVQEQTSLPQAAERDSRTKFLNTKVGAHSRVATHGRAFFDVVERVLFALILYPWEDFVSSAQIWRPFVIPWIYRANSDPFEAPPPAPDVESLSWDPDSYRASDGRLVEFDRPSTSIVKNGAFDDLEAKLSQTWRALEEACPLGHTGSSAFNPLIEHFLVRGYLEKGIDELIMHMTTIDAAIGKQQKGMTRAIGKRLKRLLNDDDASQEFKRLYDLRSAYVHGRGEDRPIPAADLTSARRLARRTAEAVLCCASMNPATSRDQMLEELDGAMP